jgi:hypothetical protein
MSVLFALAFVVFAPQANSQTGSFTFPAIGTPAKVEAAAVASVNRVFLYNSVFKTDGTKVFVGGPEWYRQASSQVTNKIQLDALTGLLITNSLKSLATSADSSIDKSRGMLIEVDCFIDAEDDSSQDVYYLNEELFNLVKNSDGSYSVPDVSGVSTEINDPIPFYIPNVQWARAEISYAGDSSGAFEIDDDLYDPGTSPLQSDGFVYLSPSTITDSSSINGSFSLKFSWFDGTFNIVDGDGNKIPETRITVGLSTVSTNSVVAVAGGDSGRGYIVQSSNDLKNWENIDPVYFVSPIPGSANFIPYTCQMPAAFFRTVTTNVPPQ